MHTLKIRKIGNSYGVILPQELLSSLKVAEGDELHAVSSKNGVELTAFDPAFERGMAAFEKGRKQYRNTLRKLAE